MSEMEYHVGKLIKIQIPEDTTLQNVVTNLIKKHNLPPRPTDHYDTDIEYLCDELYNEYFYHKKSNSLFVIDDRKVMEDDCEAKFVNKNVIEYKTGHYNGGAGFNEVLDGLLDELYTT